VNLLRHRLAKKKSPALPSNGTLKKIFRVVLSREKKSLSGEWNVLFVDDKRIRALNKKFLDENDTTDVIAFPYDAAPASDAPRGDIYICVDEAVRNAKRLGESVPRELKRLVIHGLLHILGYDDHRPADRKKMWARQEYYVKLFEEGSLPAEASAKAGVRVP
jgi:probable rRNA maturation factor